MKAIIQRILFSLLLAVILGACSGDDDTGVVVRGVVDDGTANSPLAGATCLYVNDSRQQIDQTTANALGEFTLRIPPEESGFIGCYPEAFRNLILITYLATMGASEGDTLPPQGLEEVSPRTTVVANIIAQTAPGNRQARKKELITALEAEEPDMTTLAGAATDLFNLMLAEEITDQDFSDFDSAEDSGTDAPDGGGIEGDAGDGSVFSPLVGATCKFDAEFGDSALDDLYVNGAVELPNLQSIAAQLGSDAALPGAFKALFPDGIQSLVNGQPLRTTTDDSGRYYLAAPPNTEGLVSCAQQPDLSISAFIEPRQPDAILTDQRVLPPTELFTKLIIPQLAAQDRQQTEVNFFDDIGLLGNINGPVRVETTQTPDGQLIVDTAGGTCALFVDSPQDGNIKYVAAGAVSFISTVLFKTFLIETRGPTTAAYGDILGTVLRRTDAATGLPDVTVQPQDLTAGGVPDDRATVLAPALTSCVQTGIIDFVGPVLLIRMVDAGRIRLSVVESGSNAPVPNARVEVTGNFLAFDNVGSGCPAQGDAIELEDGRIVCETNEAGSVTFVLLGTQSLAPTPVTVDIASADASLTSQVVAAISPPATVDLTVTLTPAQ